MRAGLPPGPSYPPPIQAIGFWTRPLAFLERCRARYGTPFTIRLPGTPPFVMFADPGAIREIFTAPPDVLHPGEGARVLEPIVGSHSVILLDGDAHMEQRRLMLPAFHGERMARLTELVAEIAAREIARWPRGETVALHPRLQDLTLRIILRAVFGLDPGARMEALCERLGAMLEFGDHPLSLLPQRDGAPHTELLRRVGPLAAFRHRQAEADALLLELIDERRADDEGRDDVLAMLLAARHEDGTPMSDQEVRDELLTLLVAGHETTASTLAWALDRLQHSPAVLARLRDEVRGDDDAYLTATIQEVLRRRPVLPNAAPRLVKRPIEVAGRRYEPGVALVANAYLVHHDPAVYEDPYALRPERFLDETPGTYTWIPFGGGRRRCLGASFAMLEMRIVLRELLRSCRLRPGGVVEAPQRRNITIRPRGGAQTVLEAA